ncbi:Ig-like domain-containing protein [Flavobacterium sp.]|uniref:Ig-like domain-containing protein n=1 Tax=Flavobacterium sp. TaxID=239 RepID=UPI002FDCF5A5
MRTFLPNLKITSTFFLWFTLFCFESVLSQSISVTSVTSTPVCAGTSVTVTFTTTSGSGAGNRFDTSTQFSLYFSNAIGASYTLQGSAFTLSGPFTGGNGGVTTGLQRTFVIPTSTPAGTGYRISIGSTAPSFNASGGAGASAGFTVNALSTNPTSATAGSSTICSGGSTTLTLNGGTAGTGAVIRWYSGSCGGTLVGTGNNLSVSPTSTTTYYGRYEGTCNTTACQSVTVNVNTASTNPTSATAASTTLCNGDSTTLTLNGGGGGTGAVVKWYTGSCGGILEGTGNGISVSPSATTTYYGRYEGNCNTTTCQSVTITVNTTNTWLGTTNSSWNNAANWSCGVPDANDNIVIATSSPNAPILNVDFTLVSGRTLTLSGTGSLTIGSQSNLTIAGNADFGGKSVTILSDANGTGAIGQVSGSLNNATNVTVERYIPLGKRAFRFLTPGVTTTEFISGSWQEATHVTGSTTGAGGFDATVSGSPSMYTYNNTVASGTGWTAIPNTNATNLEAGMGYRILIRGDRTPSLLTSASAANMNTAVTLSATGALRVGQVVMNASSTPAINNTTNTTTNGFSLVGNPYVCSVDWHAVSRSGLLDTYYAWDANMGTSSQRGRYVAYSVATGFNSMGNSGSSQVGRYIQPGQAFFVRNTTLGTPGTLTFDENDKADTYTSVFRTQQSYNDVTTFSKLGLLVYEPNELALGSSPIDGAVAFFGSDFTNAIDAGDVEKLESAGENVAWFNSNQKLAMATMSPVAATDELMLKTLRFTANKSYTFKFETSDFDASVSAFLVDQYLNTQTPIALNEDAFVTFTTTTDVQSYGENRFKVVFDVNALGNVNFESFVSLYPNPANGNLFYLNLPTWDENTSVVLYNALGQQIPVIAGEIDGMARQYNVPANLTKGVYYVKVAQNGKEATKKWIVNN